MLLSRIDKWLFKNGQRNRALSAYSFEREEAAIWVVGPRFRVVAVW